MNAVAADAVVAETCSYSRHDLAGAAVVVAVAVAAAVVAVPLAAELHTLVADAAVVGARSGSLPSMTGAEAEADAVLEPGAAVEGPRSRFDYQNPPKEGEVFWMMVHLMDEAEQGLAQP